MDRKSFAKAGFKGGSLLNISNRSLNVSRSHVVAETSNYRLENYGGINLPVAVIEVLSSVDHNVERSVKLSENGWAWFVCARHLIVWRFAKVSGPAAKKGLQASKAYELTLPPSDLAHRAELVAVWTTSDAKVPSCVAVSPEGTARYWPSIAHEGVSVETHADLQGQECDSLILSPNIGCVVGTTTGNVMLLQPKDDDNRHTLTYRMLKAPQGLLGSFSRRMSSFIFGSMSSHAADLRLVKLLHVEEAYEQFLLVLTSYNLQKWCISEKDNERLVYQVDVEKLAREAFIANVWSRDTASLNSLKLWMLDAQPTAHGIIILMAAMNPNISQQLHYALVGMDTRGTMPTQAFEAFCVLKISATYQNDESVLAYKFVLADQLGFLYNSAGILAVPVNEPLEDPDRIDLRTPGDAILGAGLYENRPLFFSIRHGLVVLKSVGEPKDDLTISFNDSTAFEQANKLSDSLTSTPGRSTVTAPPAEEVVDTKGTITLKAAFIHYCKKNQAQCQSVLQELFPPHSANKGTLDSLLDRFVVTLSQEIIDDYPASDQRWTGSMPAGYESTGSTVSLMMLHQLEDKQKAHDVYLNFLVQANLWSELTLVTQRRLTLATSFILGEHAEKIRAAVALRALHVPSMTIIDDAIKKVLQDRNSVPTGKLTHQNLFYREVSCIEDVIPALVAVEKESLTNNQTPSEMALLITSTNQIIFGMLQEALAHRTKKSEFFEPGDAVSNAEFWPWTASAGPKGVRPALLAQYKIILESGAMEVEDLTLRNTLWQQLMQVADVLLDGYKKHAESLQDTPAYEALLKEYHAERSRLIQPFLDAREYDRASALSEKYNEYAVLIKYCEETNDERKLNDYMDRFRDQGFSDFLCSWYLKQGKREKLLRFGRSDIASFLESQPALQWVHLQAAGRFWESANVLRHLAVEETERFTKKKTLLSLCKLSMLAAQDVDTNEAEAELENVCVDLDLLTHQEQLPEPVIQAYGLEAEHMRVLTPKELIEMYVSEENKYANELDFKKALDLLHFIRDSDEDKENLRLHIWARAILHDSWKDFDTDNLQEALRLTFVFRLVDFAFSQGMELHDLLPSVEDLLVHPDLASLSTNTTFTFLLSAGFEYVKKTFS